MPRPRKSAAPIRQENYAHTEATLPLRPEVGTQPLFRKKKEPTTYRYDSSLSPELNWDDNPAREQGEALIRKIQEAGSLEEAKSAAAQLAALSKPFLNWAGKAERLSFEVPTLPLFVHERLSTRAILETLKAHKRDQQEDFLTSLFGNPSLPVTDQVLRAYEHREQWQNRMILGDSLVAMNSLLRFENLGGQVQMIYIDPPYGVKFGSNFQPFVRKRDVSHNDDTDLTREPEMVQAYRDTWELGLHSYLTYLRDRLFLAKDLLHPSGSIFVQISDQNVHHVRGLLEEVFGAENQCSTIVWKKGTSDTNTIRNAFNYTLWYAKEIDRALPRIRKLFTARQGNEGSTEDPRKLALWGDFENGETRPLTTEEKRNIVGTRQVAKVFRIDPILEAGDDDERKGAFVFDGKDYYPKSGQCWRGKPQHMKRLHDAGRILKTNEGFGYKFYIEDYPIVERTNLWEDTGARVKDQIYVVQTYSKIIERCLLMTTSPGDLVLDPTCGSGTTATVAEQWGRRWITIDTSRVPLALARQRLLTATYDYYELNDEKRGPVSGFVYLDEEHTKNPQSIGPGIVPHVTLKTIGNNETPDHEVLVDRPEVKKGIVRVCGPFTFEATIPTPVDFEGAGVDDGGAGASEEHTNFVSRMIEILRRNPVLRLDGNRSVSLRQVRPPARTLSLHAEALVKQPSLESMALETEAQTKLPGADEKPVAFVFGPEHGAVSGKLVENAAIEARRKDYSHLYVIGFAIEANARKTIEESDAAFGIAATYVQATPDLLMGDLLKTMRSSQIFSVCGLPEIKVSRQESSVPGGEGFYQVELLGLDVFDPVAMRAEHRGGMDVPAWFLDTDYNGTVFRVCQAFFPRTGAWESLKKELKAEFEDSVWDHLAGTTSAPFPAGASKTIAVKVIDDRGNELLVAKELV